MAKEKTIGNFQPKINPLFPSYFLTSSPEMQDTLESLINELRLKGIQKKLISTCIFKDKFK